MLHAYAFKNQGHKLKTPNSHESLRVLKEHGNNLLSQYLYVGCLTMLTLAPFKHFFMLCRTRDMKIRNFLLRNRQRISYDSIVIITAHIMSGSPLSLLTSHAYNLLAKTGLVWHAKMIS